MADIRSSQVIAQVEIQVPGKIKSSQVIAQVEYTAPEPGVYTGLVKPALVPKSKYVSKYVYTGQLVSKLSPEAEIKIHYKYEGSFSVKLSPISRYAEQMTGFDWWSGYGLVDLTFLDGYPPYFAIEGDIPISITPSSVVGFYAEYSCIFKSETKVSSEFEVEFTIPPVFEVRLLEGIKAKDIFISEAIIPPVYATEFTETVGIIQASLFEFIIPLIPPTFETALSETIKIADYYDFGSVIPPVYDFVFKENIKIINKLIAEFFDVLPIYEATVTDTIEINDVALYDYFAPEIFENIYIETVKVGDDFGFTYVYPPIFDSILIDQVIVGDAFDVNIEEIYHTWVLTGLTFNPSIYSNFNFNSYCKFRGKYYGLKKDGLFLLEGNTDNGSTIHNGIKIGPSNLGNMNQKRFRSLYLGRDNDNIAVKVELGNDGTKQSAIYNISKGKLYVGRNLQGEEVTLSIADFKKLKIIELVAIMFSK